MSNISKLRPSPIAGLWYSGETETLRNQVDRYIQEAKIPPLDGDVMAIIAPHAGHRYSGKTAGHAFRCVLGSSHDLVAVISPFHSYTSQPLLTTAHEAYQTPLGPVWVDKDAANNLNQVLYKESGQKMQPLADDEEHALEIELPFLQRAVAGEFKLLPVMVHTHSEDILKGLGKALASTLAGTTSPLMVASTDLSHFYPEQIANQLDMEMLTQIASFSPEGVLNAEKQGTGFACGAGAVAAVLWAAKLLGATQVIPLHHSTSAEQTGDHSSVVGYGAAAVIKPR